MINHFTFNGTSTAQLGLIVSGVSIFGAGSRKVEKAGIPGRNGDLQIELGGFNNYTVRYTVSITNDFTTTAQQIREWLLESKGYCDLTDTYHPDEIRKACFNSDIEFTTSMLYKYGQASIQFDCLPERYLTTNTPITTTATADTTTDTTLSLSTVPTPITISLNGNTTQEGTPSPTNPQVIHNVSGDNEVKVLGKNILGFEKYTDTINGVNINISSDGAITVRGTATANGGRLGFFSYLILLKVGNYQLSKNVVNGTPKIQSVFTNVVNNSAYTDIVGVGTKTVNVTSDIDVKLGFNTVSGTVYDETFYLQLEYGSTATTYEPYTSQSYPLYLPVENYFDINTVYADTTKFTIDGDSVTALATSFHTTHFIIPSNLLGKTLTFQAYLDVQAPTSWMRMQAVANGATVYGTQLYAGESGIAKVTFTPQLATDYCYITYGNNGGYSQTIKNIQLEVGANLNHYTPYGTTPIELNKIGTYQDYIYKNGGKWYVHKTISKVDLGTLTWQYSSSYAFFFANIANRKQGSDDMLCTFYPYGGYKNDSGMSTATDKTLYRDGSTSSVIKIKDTSYTDARNFKTSVNGVLLYYPLQAATNTEITDTTLINQLNNIEKAYSYNGTTNILQVSNDNGFMLGVVSLHGSTFNSNYKGEPIITVNSTGLIYLNGEVMEVLSAPVTINCQTMQCYNGVVNMNNEVRVNDFPEIKIGSNEVGSSMALTITPNNWRH